MPICRPLCRPLTIDGSNALRGLIVRLDADERVMGMPRLLFVVSAGCLGVVLVALCALSVNFCQTRRQARFNNYSFAALAQRSADQKRQMFEDDEEDGDDDDDETEVFRRRPIKSEFGEEGEGEFGINGLAIVTENAMQPYYDEEAGQLSADDDDDDGDIAEMIGADRTQSDESDEEIVLIHR